MTYGVTTFVSSLVKGSLATGAQRRAAAEIFDGWTMHHDGKSRTKASETVPSDADGSPHSGLACGGRIVELHGLGRGHRLRYGSSMTMQPALGRGSEPSPFLVSISNIHATQEWVVTPAGSWDAASVNVTTQDQTATTTHTPGWAIVMVILFIWFFLLSLLFLLARETRVTGYVNVTVWGPGGQNYTENVPVVDAAQRADVFARVAYLQGVIGNRRAQTGI